MFFAQAAMVLVECALVALITAHDPGEQDMAERCMHTVPHTVHEVRMGIMESRSLDDLVPRTALEFGNRPIGCHPS